MLKYCPYHCKGALVPPEGPQHKYSCASFKFTFILQMVLIGQVRVLGSTMQPRLPGSGDPPRMRQREGEVSGKPLCQAIKTLLNPLFGIVF